MSGPSLTARRVAEHRAAHQLLDVPVVLEDPVALAILGITSPEDGAALIAREQGRVAAVLRAFMAARARVAEDELARQVDNGLSQYVVLGAGLDTFAYRNPFGDRLRVFEVDQAATQRWKRDRLAASTRPVPGSLAFVTVDFERDDLFPALRESGWHAGEPTLFAWLGVTMYLEAATVMQVLRTIGSLASGTGIVFDYAVAPELLGAVARQVYDEFARRVRAAGEPWVCTFDPAALGEELRASGFTTVEDLGQAELNARYFSNRRDGLQVGSLARVMQARR